MENSNNSKDNLILSDKIIKDFNKHVKKQLPEIKILDWNYLNRQINLEWHKQNADMQGVTFSEFKTTCLAHIRNQLYAGTPIDEIMIGKTMSEIEKEFAEQLINKIEDKIKAKIKIQTLSITNYTQNVQQFFNIQPFCYDKAKIFWFWNREEYKWEIIDETDLMNAIDDALAFGGETVSARVKQNYIEAFKRVGRKNKPKDMPITWIQFKENIYDYKNDEMIKATPEYFCCNPIPHDLGNNEDTPIMDKIFEEWVGKDYVKLLYEIIAYCMLQDYPLARIFAFIGSGSNGKTCYLTLLKKTIGEENCSATSMDRIIKTFGTTSFYKKLACLLGETNYNQLEKTEMLKRLSGGDLIDYEFKGKNIFSSKNYAKILIATNTLPITLDKTDGFYRRWCCIYFSNKFSEKIDIISTIPEEEYNNLCKKCLNLIKEINERRDFTNEGNLEERKQKYEKYSNPLKLFIEEKCVIDLNIDTPAFEFYNSFLNYLKERGYREMNKHEVGNLMNDLGYERKLKWVKVNKVINGIDVEEDKQWLHYLGLRFKQKYELQEKLTMLSMLTIGTVRPSTRELTLPPINIVNIDNNINENVKQTLHLDELTTENVKQTLHSDKVVNPNYISETINQQQILETIRLFEIENHSLERYDGVSSEELAERLKLSIGEIFPLLEQMKNEQLIFEPFIKGRFRILE